LKSIDTVLSCLDINVDTQVKMKVITERVKQLARVDSVDDERREALYNYQDNLFSRIVKEVEKTDNYKLKNMFFEYIELIRKDRKKEMYYEELEDKIRDSVLTYVSRTDDEFRIKQNDIEYALFRQ
jgi:hypothetical protein